jgi:hypothetical protein
VERVGIVAPNEMKKYVLDGNPINIIFKESKEPAVQQILKITQTLGKRTQVLCFDGPHRERRNDIGFSRFHYTEAG